MERGKLVHFRIRNKSQIKRLQCVLTFRDKTYATPKVSFRIKNFIRCRQFSDDANGWEVTTRTSVTIIDNERPNEESFMPKPLNCASSELFNSSMLYAPLQTNMIVLIKHRAAHCSEERKLSLELWLGMWVVTIGCVGPHMHREWVLLSLCKLIFNWSIQTKQGTSEC